MKEEETKYLLSKDSEEILVTVENRKCGICDPTRFAHRMVILTLMSFLSFGPGFCTDTPAALHDQIVEKLNIDEATFMGFYSWYSWPNMIMCLVGGYLIDRYIGVRLGGIIFAGLVLAGHCIFALGAAVRLVWVMDAGRFVFGVGCETLSIVQNTYSVLWFKTSDLSLVFGLQMSMRMIAETINLNVQLPIYNAITETNFPGDTLGITLFIASFSCIISFTCAIVLAYLDKRAEKLTNREKHDGTQIHLTDIKKFPIQIWIIYVIGLAVNVSLVTFTGLGVAYFEQKFGVSPATSHALNSLLYFLAIPMPPLLGFIVDVTGYHVYWILLAMVFCMLGLGFMTFTHLTPWIGAVLLSLSFSLWYSPLYALIAFIVPFHKLATAYGFMGSVLNLCAAVMAQISGLIVDSGGYFMFGIFVCAWSSMAMIFTIILYFVDVVKDSQLNISAKERMHKISDIGDNESVISDSATKED
ncbi:lysosomal dipeptide transporter MFSD1-like [Clavelina lepadiformis]|uniref:Lysosomal dipeptide transporter MFSD1 n=1 Tax=Clavelina lepadiformis TaxID=159417 RepID=A0ABP0FTF6_CLALP